MTIKFFNTSDLGQPEGGLIQSPSFDADEIVAKVLDKLDLSGVQVDEDKLKEDILASIDVDSIKADLQKDAVSKDDLEAVKTSVTNLAKTINRIDADLDVLGGTDE